MEAVVRAFCALDQALAVALVGHYSTAPIYLPTYALFSLPVPLTDPGWLRLNLRICRFHDLFCCRWLMRCAIMQGLTPSIGSGKAAGGGGANSRGWVIIILAVKSRLGGRVRE